jgi:hypothetical protein
MYTALQQRSDFFFLLLSRKAQQEKHFQLVFTEDGYVAGHDTTLRMDG